MSIIDLSTLPEPVYFDVNWAAQNKELAAAYESIAGVPLSKGQVEALLLATFSYRENILRINVNDIAKQNLLAFARGAVLDHLGAPWVKRLPAAKAVTTLRFTFSAELTASLFIPAGTKVKSKDSADTFVTTAGVTAIAGSLFADVAAAAAEAGVQANGYAAGDISLLVDPLPHVSGVENTTVTLGGADKEDDERLRYRIQLSPESYSVAGPEGAYEFFAMSAHQDIVDAKATSPAAGEVTVYILMKDGDLPDESMLALVESVLTPKKVRPLTDLVTAAAPEALDYEIDVQIWIKKAAEPLADSIVDTAEAKMDEYAAEMKAHLGKNIVPEQIVGILQRIAGMHRAVVIAPAHTELDVDQVTICSNITVTLVGSVDE